MKSAVIFGGCGYIGVNFVEFLSKKNEFQFIYLVDIRKPLQNFIKQKFEKIIKQENIEYIETNIKKKISLNVKGNVTLIADFAAVHREPGHSKNEYYDTNVKGSENICEFAKYTNCKNIIFTSSISVYGYGDHEKSELTDPNPTTHYGKSKLIAEKNYINWQKNDSNFNILTICRPGVVFGPGETGNVTRLIKVIKKGLFIYMGNKNLKKGGIYIKELINTFFWVNEMQIQGKLNKFEIYNATFEPCPTISDYAKSILNIMNLNKKFISIPKFFIKFTIELTSFITKNLSENSNFHYIRLNKLFISNFIKPKFLLDNNYKFIYNLDTSLNDWKLVNKDDWN